MYGEVNTRYESGQMGRRPDNSETILSTDVLIVGAGPTGLYAAYYAGFRGLTCVIADSLPEAGGQIAAMYPEKKIFDVAGFPAVRGRQLVDNLVEQAGQFRPTYLLGHAATELRYEEGWPLVTTAQGTTVCCRAVIVTGGVGTFEPRRLATGREFEGRGVSYFVPSLKEHADKDVVIVGGGDSAFDWARTLEPLARSVTLVHRRNRFRGHERTVQEVLDSTVEVLTDSEVARLEGADRLEAVEIRHRQGGQSRVLKAQRLIAALGFVADLGPMPRWGLEINERRIAVDTAMRTNLPNVFAAGDITAYAGKVRLLSVGFGEAATAINNAAITLDPVASLFPGHSTDFR